MGRRPSLVISMTDCNIAQIIETYEITGVLAFPASGVAHVSENAEDVGDWTHAGTLDAAIQQSVIRVSQGETAVISGVRKSCGEAVDLLFTDNTVPLCSGTRPHPTCIPTGTNFVPSLFVHSTSPMGSTTTCSTSIEVSRTYRSPRCLLSC
jgi:hypothetical protein